jgi:hypothetical protein
VLPGVDAEEGLVVAGDGVLVGAGDETEGARGLVLDEPGPAGALDAGEGGVGLLLEVLEGAEVLVDGSLRIRLVRGFDRVNWRRLWNAAYQELALGLTTTALAVGSQVLPEQGVVDVAATVEVEEGSLSGGSLGIALGLGLGDGLDGRVEAVDVGLVVLGVVQLHDLAGDVGLEGTIVIWGGRAHCQSLVDG